MGFKSRATPGGTLFSGEMIQFLGELEINNDRGWFTSNKERYETFVREPALELIRQMAPHITAISGHFEAVDKKVGGSLMRVYRDTRFGKDKTPYKTNVGIQFRHRAGKDVHAPGFYLHIALAECFLAVGSWRPESESLGAIRRRIAAAPREWKTARDDRTFRRFYEIGGESLVRMPRGFPDDAPFPDDLRRKDHIAIAEMGIDDAIGPDLVAFLAERFAAARPYMRFLTRAVGAPF